MSIGLEDWQLDLIWDAAQRLADEVPIVGEFATDDECRRRRLALDAVLDEWWEELGEPRPVGHVWHSIKYFDGSVGGCWAEDETAAALNDMLWRGKPAKRCIADPDQEWRTAWMKASAEVAIDDAGALVPTGGLLDLLTEPSERVSDTP